MKSNLTAGVYAQPACQRAGRRLAGRLTNQHSRGVGRWLSGALAIAAALCSNVAGAQQRPLQSLYMFDPLLVNPAYAGTHVQLSGTAIYRNQWVNFDGAPKTFTGTVHSGFRKARVGLGLIFANDQIGVHSDNSLYGVYSYKIPVSLRKNGGVLSR